MNLLIVNDEILTADSLKNGIDWQQFGIEKAYVAYNADEAREVMKKQKIDILLCDIEMPEENGISLMRWVREKEYRTECIFLTCHASFEYAQEAVRLGIRDYILIPAKKEDIGNAVKKVVGRRKEMDKNLQMQAVGERWVKAKTDEAKERQGETKSSQDVVKECEQYIMKNIGDAELTVNSVAAHCYLNPIYLNRIFKKEKEISIGQYIIRERMILAAALLEKEELNASTVADRTGYPNYSYFSTAFKKYYGCSPQQYKEERRSRK